MGLLKKVELDNGITVNYHRITSINKITNQTTMIEVSSYTSKDKREEEKRAIQEGQEKGEAVEMNVFIETTYINKDYEQNETIEDLYNYLKLQDKFKDAENS